jgi:UDP-2,4-diacetamido-2,4,6-trideoxy-beta-L-altropyranose hydrolase
MLVAIRADASIRLGTGHVMRSAALGLALRRLGARPVFLCATASGDMAGWLGTQGFDTILLETDLDGAVPPWRISARADAAATRRALDAMQTRPEWLVVDHYGLDAAWERNVRRSVTRLLAIDDLADRAHEVDVLVDPNLQPNQRRYDHLVPKACRRLTGPRFALLRPEFSSTGPRAANRPRRLMACMGGTDPQDALSTVLDAWEQLPLPRPALDVVVGQASPNVPSLRRRCAVLAGVSLHVQTGEMVRLMDAADLLIGSAGGINWERCSAGLPALIGITADNQRHNLAELVRARTGLSVGRWTSASPHDLATLIAKLMARPLLLQRMSARAAALVDGRGAERVAAHMLARHVLLRHASLADAEPAWAWRNAQSTRRHFHDPRAVPLAEHLAWWARSLDDPARELFVAAIGDLPVGVLRLDHGETSSTVSIYLDPAMVGLGLGPHMLRALQTHSLSGSRHPRLRAEVLDTNVASLAAFERAGFVRGLNEWTWEPVS